MTVDDCVGGLAKNWLVFTTTPANTNPGDRLTGGRTCAVHRKKHSVQENTPKRHYSNSIIIIAWTRRVTCRIEFITPHVTFSNIYYNIYITYMNIIITILWLILLSEQIPQHNFNIFISEVKFSVNIIFNRSCQIKSFFFESYTAYSTSILVISIITNWCSFFTPSSYFSLLRRCIFKLIIYLLKCSNIILIKIWNILTFFRQEIINIL